MKQAIVYNLLSALMAYVGMLIGTAVGQYTESVTSWIFAITAGMFLYVALVDMVSWASARRRAGLPGEEGVTPSRSAPPILHHFMSFFVPSCPKCFTGTARTTSAASWDTSSCRTSAWSPGSPSCCSSPSSRTKSFLILVSSPGGERGEVFCEVKEGRLRCVGTFVGLHVLCLRCQRPPASRPRPPFQTSCRS